MGKYCSIYSVKIQIPVDLDNLSPDVSALLQEEGIDEAVDKAEMVARIKLFEALTSVPFNVIDFNAEYTERIL